MVVKEASSTVLRRRPTIKDIAALASVSPWTVSQVIRGNAESAISQATRDRVLAIASEIDYRPNLAAVALNNSRTNLIEMWICTHPEYSAFFGWVQHTFYTVAARDGYRCITENIPMQLSWRNTCPNSLRWPVDGIVAIDTGGAVRAYQKTHPNDQVPIVNMGAQCGEETDYVKIDHKPGSIASCEHLIEQGCRRIAFMGRLPRDERAKTYIEVMSAAERPLELIMLEADTRAAAYAGFREYTAERGVPDGLICLNDDIAMGVLGSAFAMGLSVPKDLAIVGCDGIEDTLYAAVPITTVQLDVEEYCTMAWEILKSKIDQPAHPTRRRIVTPRLVVRASSLRRG